jgi:sortase (surface protein transpeptidase)
MRLSITLPSALFLACLGIQHVVAPAYVGPVVRAIPQAIVPVTHAQAAAPDVPVALAIPTIGLQTQIVSVGINEDGKMGIPPIPQQAGWFNDSARPGETGAAIIDGVLDTKTGPAVFWRLKDVKPGNSITIRDATGMDRTFTVRATKLYNVRGAPLDEIYRGAGGTELRLITCAGKWDTSLGHYDQRLVVFADME